MEDKAKSAQAVLRGLVTSDKMDKTIVVQVESRNAHPRYKKIVRSFKKFKAHDETNQCGVGDLVEIVGCRPLSKDKTWRLNTVVEKAK